LDKHDFYLGNVLCLSYFNNYYSISSDFFLDCISLGYFLYDTVANCASDCYLWPNHLADNYPALFYRRRKINLAAVHRKGTKSAVKLAMMVAKGLVERMRAPVQISNTILTRQWRTTRPHSIPKRKPSLITKWKL